MYLTYTVQKAWKLLLLPFKVAVAVPVAGASFGLGSNDGSYYVEYFLDLS